MQADPDNVVMTIPREPFLPHSAQLFKHLCATITGPVKQILEIGCGPNSPLVPTLRQLFPDARLMQVDALQSVVEQARAANPECQVEQMLASDLRGIADETCDLVVGMSVFDQNPVAALPGIAAEIHRVLKPAGHVAYIHNEEINLPAQADSFMRQRNQLLLPSPRWTPWGDIEYCAGDRRDIEAQITQNPQQYGPVIEYLLGILPQVYATERKSEVGEVRVPFLNQCDPQRMARIRSTVAQLEGQLGRSLTDYSTGQLLAEHLANQLFSAGHGFQTQVANLFQQQSVSAWQSFFSQPPPTSTFVRGCTRYGVSCQQPPAAGPSATPLGQPWPAAGDSQLTLVSYQFGLRAVKR